MATIKVSSSLSTESENLKNIAADISASNELIKNQIDMLEKVWQGDAANTIVKNFLSLNLIKEDWSIYNFNSSETMVKNLRNSSDQFQSTFTVVNQLAIYLKEVVDQMNQTEQDAKNGADILQSLDPKSRKFT